jgi:lysophospholipid acyltransferase (LPLAT)-like uncharacterized protein
VRALVPPLAAGWLRLARATMRLRWHGRETALPADGRPVIYCFWHAQLAMMPWVQIRPPSVVPISRSTDGDLTVDIFSRLEVEAVRGSTSRGGSSAVRGMLRAARAGQDMAITPDGPRGPAGVVQPGAAWLSQATGCPLLPVAFAARPALYIGSWDRMIFPLPFARGAFAYGERLQVPRDADERQLSAATSELERRLHELSGLAASMLVRS